MKTVELGRPSRRGRQQPESDNLFGWTVFILLLCGFAFACWIGTFYVFSHPEQAFSYRILTKLNKLEPPKRFELTAAPLGEFETPQKLLQRFGAMTQDQLEEASNELTRDYLRNYDHLIGKVPYVTGKFTILDAQPLNENRYFESGVVVIAQSVDLPSVYIEHIFPATKEDTAAMERVLVTGLGIELKRSYDLSAVVHVSNLGNGRLLFTLMPLLYGPYGTTGSGSGFQLEPPKLLNIKAGLPVVTSGEVRNAEQRYAEYRKATGSPVSSLASAQVRRSGSAPEKSAPPAPPSLVRVEKALPLNPTPAPGSSKGKGGPASGKVATATSSPAPARADLVESKPPPTLATPSSPVQPVLTASPPPSTTGKVDAWPTYHPGQMPRGRLLDVEHMADLADKGLGKESLYLRGDFTVTAVRENRAVLRSHQSLAERMLNRGNARVIVEYPQGISAPKEGENLARGADRPFQIVDVRKSADGQLNIYVREVTTTN